MGGEDKMTLPHIGAAKIGAWIVGSVSVLIAALAQATKQGMSPLIIVALIMSASSLLVAIITGGVSIYLQRQTVKKVNGMLAIKDQKDAELTETKEKLAHSVGRREGMEAEAKDSGK